MVFSSILFICLFLPLCVLGYLWVPKSWKNGWLALASIVFYFWGAPSFFVLLFGALSVDYLLVQYALKSGKKWPINLTIFASVLLLIYYKYAHFAVENIDVLISLPASWLSFTENIVLPIGISFVSFQRISFAVDVHRKNVATPPSFGNYLLYILFFPQLIAGPIVRYKDIANQIIHRNLGFSTLQCYHGFIRFTLGLTKKVVIANTLSDAIQDVDFTGLETGGALLWALTYAMQLYFDFSGYSDMAIGLARMFSFKIPENFMWPYTANSITDFWRKWHITLGKWMMDYLYIPLGGNQNGAWKTYRNLIIVFLVSGIWHGASWNFVIWGAYHGLFLVIERLFLGQVLRKLPKGVRLAYVGIIVIYGFAIFNLSQWPQLVRFHTQLFSGQWQTLPIWVNAKYLTTLGLALAGTYAGLFLAKKFNTMYLRMLTSGYVHLQFWTSLMAFIYCLAQLFTSNFNPFIYFRF